MTELAFLTIAEASRLIAKRELSPVELTEACLRRIKTLDSQLDSFVTVTAERARAEAKAAQAAIMPNVERFCTYRQSLDYVRKYCPFLTAREKDLILGDNCAAFYGIGKSGV